VYSGIGKKMLSKEAKEAGLWINSLTITNPKILNAKKFFDFEYGSNISITNANLHDGDVLPEAEKGFHSIVFKVSHSTIEYQTYDSFGGKSKKIGNQLIFRHKNAVDKKEGDSTTLFLNRFLRRNKK